MGAILLLLGFGIFTGAFSAIGNKNERFVLVFHENMYGLYEGGKVTLNGVRIGRVERFFLGDAVDDAPVPVLVEINRKLVRRHMVERGNEIFDQEGKFKQDIIPKLVGQLIQESFVTGILYVNLTTDEIASENNSEVTTLYGYQKLRTQESIFAELSDSINLDKLSSQISQLMEVTTSRLEQLDLKTLSSDFTNTNVALQSFINNFSAAYLELGPSMTQTSNEASDAFAKIALLSDQLNETLGPNSDLRFAFQNSMREVSSMAKSLKALADLLERNPQAILRGKNANEN